MKRGIVAAMLVALCAVQAGAAERAPSSAKLSKLGLGSMEVVSDSAGDEVRGSGFAVVGANLILSSGGGGIVPWGFGFFFPGGPIGPWGGSTLQQSGAATGGILLPPAPLVPAAATITIPATAIGNAVIVNGFNVNTSAFVSGGITAAGF